MKLNLGSGAVRVDGWTNVDIAAIDGVDVVHDLDVSPWPWDDGSVDEICAFDIFEHVNNPVTFVCEAWRILKPGARFVIRTTNWRSMSAYTDPTHKRFCTPHTFDYWVKGTPYFRHNAAYGGAVFTKEHYGPDGTEQMFVFRKVPGA